MPDFPPMSVDAVIARDQARLEREDDPGILFLGPRCQVITGDGRQWCEDPQPCDEGDCPHKPVKYIRYDLAVAGGFVQPHK